MVAMYDYMSSRGGKYPSTVFVGLQGLIKQYLMEPITVSDLNQARDFAKLHGIPFDYEGWAHIIFKCKGLLPITIKAVNEGSLIPTGKPLLTVESTDPIVPWIAGWVETLLMKLWYPTNIATKSYYVRKMLERYGSPEWAQFAYHNFGDRGASSVESAAIGGFAHLTQFMGTDCFNSLSYCYDNYNVIDIAGYSVYATEHSTTTANPDEEQFVYDQLVANPNLPIMSFVADSYDVYKFTHFCTDPDSRIRKLIESRPNQKLVLRPDSGNHLEVINRMLNIMEHNSLIIAHDNTKVLFRDFGILWGDGITPETIEEILNIQTMNGFAAENFVFGSGGDLMQNHTRDTQKFAIKCSSIDVEVIRLDEAEPYIKSRDVFKDPITDPGKKSLKGKVTAYYNKSTDTYFVDRVDAEFDSSVINCLSTVFHNGQLLKDWTLDEIRSHSRN